MTSTSEVALLPDGALLTARQAATLFGIGLASFYRHRSAGTIPAAIRIGHSVRWRKRDLESWLDSKKERAA